MDAYLTTARLRLRPFTADDLGPLVELDGDPEVMRHLDAGRPLDPETVRTVTLPRLLGPGYWAAEELAGGAFVGWFELRALADPGERELGYRLLRAAWGRGYATEGARALVRLGFTELGARRILATTMSVNTRSRRVMEKVGLRHVRTFFEDWPEPAEGAEHGDVEYALSRADWERDHQR
ncbi:GNAT family N-acetyltransferase [Streptomyces millisiae]|uniref:GNAT family N-acetyltransferase n=1 Tax=Streptomyces millisiae TaxID=3075542 RepID=A0ABU2LPE3_9ACTN|nr:GNAT family N-acetyltransferase [Streptomyces sp. DSM 44918]MDT0319461.1 GNAT family N-acetyltransferase [Streptomyces sp. DSM 44918]